MTEDPTRELILDFLFQHSPVSASEIGSHLGITQAAVRYHLRALIQDGRAEAVLPIVSRQPAPGRPGRLYRISTQSRPDNLVTLVRILLMSRLKGLHDPQREEFYQELAEQISQADPIGYAQKSGRAERLHPAEMPNPGPPAHHGLPSRLAAALALLNRMNYTATWEARRQGPQVIFHNCPYASVWRSFPDLCVMDTYLVQNLLSAPAIRLRNIDPDVLEARTCLFQVEQAK